MASASSKLLAEPGSTGSTFSYAQAAKGRTASAAASTVQSSQATSGTNTPSKDVSAAMDGSSGFQNGSKISDTENAPGLNGENGTGSGKLPGHSESGTEIKTSGLGSLSSPTSPSFVVAPTSTLPKEDDMVPSPNLYSESPWDRNSVSEVSSDKAAEGSERKKTKKNKKEKGIDKDCDKEKEEIKPEILVAAPPPAVNIWEQRKEAQALKAKVSPQVIEPSLTTSGEYMGNGSEQPSVVKNTETKRRAKALTSDELDRTTGSVTAKEPPTSKSQKRGPDSSIKLKDDAGTKRAPRGSRVSEKEDKSAFIQAPPPVEDAISWPTPETALEEEKRKSQEKAEKEDKEDSASNKPREKKEWMKVPFTPSVTFNTPLPSRGRGNRGGGGRGSRESGGRSGHATNGSISGDKNASFTAAGVNSGTETRERGREGGSAARAASLPPNASKRPSDSSNTNKDQRKPSIASAFDRTKVDAVTALNKKDQSSAGQNQQVSAGAQIESVLASSSDPRPQVAEPAKIQKSDQPNDISSESHIHPRGGADRRSEPNIRMPDFSKDNAHSQVRERSDGRAERGRGNYRGGRGSHASFSNGSQHAQHSYVNGQSAQPPNGYGMRSSTGPYSPPLAQPQYPPNFQQPPSGRNGRVVPSRAQSIPNINPIYARFPPNPQGSGPQMPPIQTAGPIFDYPPNMQSMQSMSAVPFNPYIEQYSVLAMVSMQLEYYFSIDNLCKDVFLRKHMDGQGFVFLSFIASFKRIQSLTADFELLRFACQESEVIEIVVGEDGIDRLRRQDGWEKWVLPVEERDELARHNGPERYYRQMPPQRAQQIHPRMMMQSGQPMSPPAFSPNSAEPRFQLQAPVAAAVPSNGIDSGFTNLIESPLSAAVPDFSPKSSPIPSADKSNESSLDTETTFTDEQVEKLNLVYTQNGQADAKPRAPFHSASSRTFSNGSIDGRSITEELQELEKRSNRGLANGSSNGAELSPDGLRRSRSPFGMSPTKLVFGNAPPVMWTKDPRVQDSVPESTKEESYNVICARALRHRETSAPGETGYDMRLLYQFWSHFLVRNFNPRMYEEFRRCAFDDSIRRQASFGMINLITYYNEVLNSRKRIIPEIFARHYVELVKAEDPSGERPGFAKLRASWRNGALDMKSRKKIDNFVDPDLRAELEK